MFGTNFSKLEFSENININYSFLYLFLNINVKWTYLNSIFLVLVFVKNINYFTLYVTV
jgi:hypothetical protein